MPSLLTCAVNFGKDLPLRLLFIFTTAVSAGLAGASEYEIEGSARFKNLDRAGNVRTELKSSFRVFVRDCGWLIEVIDLDENNDPKGGRETGSTNGAEIFTLSLPIEPRKTQTLAQAVSGTSSNQVVRRLRRNVASIVSNSVPVSSISESVVSHLWLMFASHCYFAGLTTNQLTPVFDVTAYVLHRPDLKVPAQWELTGGTVPLPKAVTYYNETNEPPGKRAQYSATGLTNVGRMTLPTGFIFEEFFGGNVRRRVDVVVTAVRPTCSEVSLLPSIQGKALVNDYRLIGANPPIKSFTYSTPRKGWVSVQEARKVQAMQRRRGSSRTPRWLVPLFVSLAGTSCGHHTCAPVGAKEIGGHLFAVHHRFPIVVAVGHVLFLVLCTAGALFLFAPDIAFEDAFSSWDAKSYLHLAQDGYTRGDSACAFYPLLPLLIRALAPVFAGSYFWAGLVLTNVLGVVAVLLFYRLVLFDFGEAAARRSLVALLAFPTAFFFSVIYTESLFFLELMLVFWGIKTQRFWLTATASFLMPLTKAIGIFILPVLLWHWFERFREKSDRRSFWLMTASAPVFGWLTYLYLMQLWTGGPFEGFKAQRFYPYQPSVQNVFNVTKWGSAFLHWGSLHDSMDSILDRTCFIAFLVSLYWVWKLGKLHFGWAILAGLVPALSSCFFSYVRYTLCVFSLFIVIGVIFFEPRRQWLFWYYIAMLLNLQGYLMIRYLQHLWAG